MLGSSLSYGDSNYSTDQIHSIFRSVSRLFVFKNEAKMFFRESSCVISACTSSYSYEKEIEIEKALQNFQE